MLAEEEVTNQTHLDIWHFYSSYVDAHGTLPSIRLNDQPYGVLPVTDYRRIAKAGQSKSLQEKRNLLLTRLFDKWLEWATADRPDEVLGESTTTTSEDLKFNYVPRLDDTLPAEFREEELVRILSMEPSSTRFQYRLMELARIPAWFSNLVTTPQAINSYSPWIIDQLMKGRPQYGRDFSYVTVAKNELLEAVGPAIFSEAVLQKLERAPVFTLKDIQAYPLSDLNQTPENTSPFLPLTLKHNWFKEEYATFLKAINKDNKDSLIGYGGKHSLFVNLLLGSYSQALHLFYRDVYFKPKIEEVDGIAYYKIKRILKAVNDEIQEGETIVELEIPTANTAGAPMRIVTISAPFAGKIEHIFVEKDMVFDRAWEITKGYSWDRRVFRLKDEVGYNTMKEEMISLGAQVSVELERLADVEGIDLMKEQQSAVAAALDLNTYRLDAWLTGISTERLAKLRQDNPTGTYFGAYGWVENLEKNEKEVTYYEELATNVQPLLVDQYDPELGGFIHCPSPAQAVTAAMFRQSFSTYRPETNNDEVLHTSGSPYNLNLTSDRIQKGKRFMEGIRQGQEMEALLGYRLEEFLQEAVKKNTFRYSDLLALRVKYPLQFNKLEEQGEEGGIPQMTVINGLAFLNDRSSFTDDETLTAGADLIADILDGCADLLFFEAGHQMSQGNFSQAAAAMDAAKGIIEPPKVEAVDTLEHKLMLLFESPDESGLAVPSDNPKAFIEPTLEKWLSQWLGSKSSISCRVRLYRQDGEEKVYVDKMDEEGEKGELITMEELNIGFLDLLELSFNPLDAGASELEQRMISLLEIQQGRIVDGVRYEFSAAVPKGHQNMQDVIEVMPYVHALLRESRALRVEDIAHIKELNRSAGDENGDHITYPTEYLDELLAKLKTCLTELSKSDISPTVLAKYQIQNAKGGLVRTGVGYQARVDKEVAKMTNGANALLSTFEDKRDELPFAVQVDRLEEVAQLLFGKHFLLIPPFISTSAFRDKLKGDLTALVGEDGTILGSGKTGGQERIRHWLEGRAAVDIQTATFSDWLMVGEAWRGENTPNLRNPKLENWNFSLVQYTSQQDFPWTALDVDEIQALRSNIDPGEYPDDSQSMVIYKHRDQPANEAWQYGLLIDHFPEFMPEKEMDTGLAFEYNAPNAEAPQAILLAVASDRQNWNEDRLCDIVNDTLDLAKARMVDTDALRGFGNILPMSYWFNIPNKL